jgi:hypothetical protein
MSLPEMRTPELRETIREQIIRFYTDETPEYLEQPMAWEISRPDGQTRFIQSTLFRIRFVDIIRLGAVVRDVTDQVRYEKELRESKRVLEERIAAAIDEIREKDRILLMQSRLAAMGEIIGHIAHQWRQPLNALGVTVQNIHFAAQAGRADNAYIERAVGKSMELVHFMSSTIDDFRRFFKRDEKKTSFDLTENVRRTLGLVGDTFRHDGIEIHLQVHGNPRAEGYPNEFSQVLLNLLANARDAFQERKIPNPVLRVHVGKSPKGRTLISVIDNAGGIEPSALDRIFEPYFTTREKGTGIGLYMCQTIVEENMGGKISAKNTGDGAEFTVEI